MWLGGYICGYVVRLLYIGGYVVRWSRPTSVWGA